MTPEEAKLINIANELTGNHLSSVKIIHGAKAVTWEVKAKHDNVQVACTVAMEIDRILQDKYNTKEAI